jgi:hypothetical protein
VNPLEERLREAYRAAADTVRPETVLPGGVRGLHRDGHPAARPGRRGRSRSRLLVPLAAAVAVTVVVGTAYVLGSQLFARHGGGRHAAAPTTPAFFVALYWAPNNPPMSVVNAATGAVGAQILLPNAAGALVGVATGDGRTFVAAADELGACRTALYRFVVAADGTPTTPTRFATVPGLVRGFWGMAVLGNGRTVVYDTTGCQQVTRPGETLRGYLAMVNTATGQAKRWTFTERRGDLAMLPSGLDIVWTSLPPCYGDMSLSAGQGTIGFCDRVVPTSAAPGPLVQRGGSIVRNTEPGRATIHGMVVAPDGKTAYFATYRVQHNKRIGRNWQLRAMDLATGQTRLIRSFPGTQGAEPAVAADPTGRYLLVEYKQPTGPRGIRLARLDLKTGRVTQLNFNWPFNAAIAW